MKFFLSLVVASLGWGLASLSAQALPLSPGDRIQVSIPNEKYFAGVYEINEEGNIEVPYIGSLSVVGLEPSTVTNILREILIDQGYFPPNNLQISTEVILWAPVSVGVSGDVFLPGTTLINEVAEEVPKSGVLDAARQVSGDYPPNRKLTSALRSAGGVMPTADVKHIRLIRGNQTYEFDLSGVFTGKPIRDVPLIAGDQIVVPVADKFQPELVRPSEITPPGIKVAVSNLIVPAFNNAGASISNRTEGIVFAYGARMSHAVFSTNCVGGIKSTNARRRAVLVRVDTKSGETIAFERSIEDLIRNSKSDRDNPFLMKEDSVACYDSTVTNARDIFNSLSDLFGPLKIIKDIFF